MTSAGGARDCGSVFLPRRVSSNQSGPVIQFGPTRMPFKRSDRNYAMSTRLCSLGRRGASATTSLPTTTTTTAAATGFSQLGAVVRRQTTTRQLQERHEDGSVVDASLCFWLRAAATRCLRCPAPCNLRLAVRCVWCAASAGRSYLLMPASPPSDRGALR